MTEPKIGKCTIKHLYVNGVHMEMGTNKVEAILEMYAKGLTIRWVEDTRDGRFLHEDEPELHIEISAPPELLNYIAAQVETARIEATFVLQKETT